MGLFVDAQPYPLALALNIIVMIDCAVNRLIVLSAEQQILCYVDQILLATTQLQFH